MDKKEIKTNEEKIKNSFILIKQDILLLTQEINILKNEINELKKIVSFLSSTYPTPNKNPAHPSTNDFENYGLIPQNFDVSIGNKGVPADRQTDRQKTDKQTDNKKISFFLNNLKQELKEKFKNLTKQELFIFSVLYILQEEKQTVTYKDLSLRTKLTQSSIRDYITRIEQKGIPLIKEKLNNKIILLKLPQELKEIIPLNTLIKS